MILKNKNKLALVLSFASSISFALIPIITTYGISGSGGYDDGTNNVQSSQQKSSENILGQWWFWLIIGILILIAIIVVSLILFATKRNDRGSSRTNHEDYHLDRRERKPKKDEKKKAYKKAKSGKEGEVAYYQSIDKKIKKQKLDDKHKNSGNKKINTTITHVRQHVENSNRPSMNRPNHTPNQQAQKVIQTKHNSFSNQSHNLQNSHSSPIRQNQPPKK